MERSVKGDTHLEMNNLMVTLNMDSETSVLDKPAISLHKSETHITRTT